ncbi:GNAT family N-acetyltransferase [Novosphingobium sp.]|uniref:GNAT family N-acetyltransferase n=1 Tax=Novosphingobium sp. TaxID=1874826 RepID=UPI003B519315
MMYTAATDADVPAIVALMNAAYRGSGWSTEAGHIAGDRTNAALVRAEIAATPAGSFLKWVDGDRLSGCVWLEPLADGVWYLGSLAADPAAQNAGLGKTLLAAAEQWVIARGGRRVRMSVVHVREGLIAWYDRRGYRRTGETEPFPYGDNRFGTPLRDDLAFAILEKDLGS